MRPPALFLPLALTMLPAAALAGQDELIMLAPTDQSMPISRIQNGVLTGGIIKDVGDAIAQRLGRRASYLATDVPDVMPTLTSGRADAICYVLPFWIDGDYNWTQPLIPDSELVAARTDAPHLRSLKDLRDRPVGTVAGYRYPRVQQVLGERFKRLDVLNMDLNIERLLAGKTQYTIIGESALNYLHRTHPALQVRADLVFSTFKAQCAFSRKSSVPFDQVGKVVDGLIKDGTIDQILARYR